MTAATIASYMTNLPRMAMQEAAELLQTASCGTHAERCAATQGITLLVCKYNESARCCAACPYHCENRPQ